MQSIEDKIEHHAVTQYQLRRAAARSLTDSAAGRSAKIDEERQA
jgi:hypothetical protein